MAINQTARPKKRVIRERESEREELSSVNTARLRLTALLDIQRPREGQQPPQTLLLFSQHCDDGLLPEPSAHLASLSLNLTKMKVYVSTQVGVTMETTVIQCSQQKQLYERSCLMELKSRLGPSFHAITTHGIGSPTTQGKCVHDSMHFIKHINTVLSFLFIRSCAAARKMFCEMITEMNEWDQRKLDDKGKQTLYIFFFLFSFTKSLKASLDIISSHRDGFS